ncbi:MAG: hypothetical protein IKI43_00645, partial [Campylobacter sp.]|nr:hypothetical protein [Campylobacter sp.]
MATRKEHDFIGELEIDDSLYYGVQTFRAVENFNISHEKLKDFPVITKNDIKANQDSFLSNQYDKDKLIQMSTSGSTGTPFVTYQNAKKKKWVNAEVIYYSEKVGYRLGDNL